METIAPATDEMKPVQESIISKIGFWQGLIVAVIGIVTAYTTATLFFGSAIQRLDQIEKDQKEIELKYAGLDDRLRRIEEKMVDKEDFREMRRELQGYFTRTK